MADAVWHVVLVVALGVVLPVVVQATDPGTSGSSRSRLPKQVEGLQALPTILHPHWTRGNTWECLPGRVEGLLHLLTIRHRHRTREGSVVLG